MLLPQVWINEVTNLFVIFQLSSFWGLRLIRGRMQVMKYPNLLEQNLYGDGLRDKFLLIGSCLPDLYPELVKRFEKEWGQCFFSLSGKTSL